jgi:hypothetical protein
MNKNNINLPDYSPTPESGVKYWFKFILFLFIIFYFIYQKIYIYIGACLKNKLIYLFTYTRVRNKKIADLILFILFIYLFIY